MNQQLNDFLLKGGRLIDPAGGKDGMFDIRVRDGKIDAIAADLDPAGASVVDVEGRIVTPGLIDVHLHLMKGLGAFGVDPDIFGVGSGVTTVVDAGSAGHTLLNVFRNYVTANAKTRVLNYINLSTLGGVSGPAPDDRRGPRPDRARGSFGARARRRLQRLGTRAPRGRGRNADRRLLRPDEPRANGARPFERAGPGRRAYEGSYGGRSR